MDRAQFVFVGSLDAIIAHRHKGDPIGWTREKGTDCRLCGDQRGRVEPLGPACHDDALCPGAGPLNARLAAEIDAGNLRRRVAEIKVRRP